MRSLEGKTEEEGLHNSKFNDDSNYIALFELHLHLV